MKARNPLRGALWFAVALAIAAPAEAQLFRAYLSTSGNDANPCTLPQPCRLLPAALAAVASGGEVWLLDSANYNTATVEISKSVTILAVPGAVGSVVATGGPAISIGTAGANVVLRNLVIVPLPGAGGTIGINMTAGSSLAVDGSLIANMVDSCIKVSGDISVHLTATTVRSCGNYGLRIASGASASVTGSVFSGSSMGIYVVANSPSSSVSAEIADSTFDANNAGVVVHAFDATGTATASLHQCRLVRNSYGGYAPPNADGQASIALGDNLVSGNETGIIAVNGGASAWLAGSTVSHNGIGLHNNGTLFESAGNNAVRRNGTDTLGTITVIPPK